MVTIRVRAGSLCVAIRVARSELSQATERPADGGGPCESRSQKD
jgi:hypothetical protein